MNLCYAASGTPSVPCFQCWLGHSVPTGPPDLRAFWLRVIGAPLNLPNSRGQLTIITAISEFTED
jgi:hypothetical protein